MPFAYQVLQTSRNFCFSGLFQCQCLHCGTVDVTDLGAVHKKCPNPLVYFYARELVEVIPQCSHLAGSKPLFFFFFLMAHCPGTNGFWPAGEL